MLNNTKFWVDIVDNSFMISCPFTLAFKDSFFMELYFLQPGLKI